jgi:hypothetical protein
MTDMDLLDFQPETDEQAEARRSGIRQDVADLLGELGYELDSDDETFELLEWAFERTPESPVTPEQGPIERCRECGREEWGHSWLDHVK